MNYDNIKHIHYKKKNQNSIISYLKIYYKKRKCKKQKGKEKYFKIHR